MFRLATLPLIAFLIGCGEAGPPETNGAAERDLNVSDCPVIESTNWKAWINAMPGPDGPRLHVTGDVTLPTPGYTAAWTLGPTDRAMPPGQTLNLAFAAPTDMVAQVLTTQEIAYEGEAVYSTYRVIRVVCGETLLAEITDIETAQ